MDAAEFDRTMVRVRAFADDNDFEACERELIGLLARVRDRDLALELRAINNLAGAYGRTGRVFEALIMARRGVEMARKGGVAYHEARGLSGVCIGRYGLFMGADLSEDVERLRELLTQIPEEDRSVILLMEAEYVEVIHAMQERAWDRARAHVEKFRAIATRLDRDQELADTVQLGNRAIIALRRGDPERALSLLDEIRDRGVAAPYHAPELSVLRVQAHIARGDQDAAREDARAALDAIENAPASAKSDCIHYGALLADALESLGEVELARRAYDVVATAVFERVQQLDACMSALPELGLSAENHGADLVRYRKAFVSKQQALLARVAEMFRGQDASELRKLLDAEGEDSFIAICAWCESVRDEDGRWMGIGHLVPRVGFNITHGVCPTCAAKAMA